MSARVNWNRATAIAAAALLLGLSGCGVLPRLPTDTKPERCFSEPRAFDGSASCADSAGSADCDVLCGESSPRR